MTAKTEHPVPRNRMYFLDNVRTVMVFLVVLVHTGLVYENSGIGAFFWLVDDPATNAIAGKINQVVDIFVMSVLFFISGYLTPPSLAAKSPWKFLQTKFQRLVVPWFLAVLTLMPLYKFIFLYSRGMPQESWTNYFHFSNGVFSQNWLWFLPVLFLFDVLYLLLAQFKLKTPHMNLHAWIAGVFVVGFLYSFAMDMFNMHGWTKTWLLDFQNERLLVYFLVFLLGSQCYRQDVFSGQKKRTKLYFFALFTVWIPVYFYLVFHRQSFVFPGVFIYSRLTDSLLLWATFHISLLMTLYVIITTFRLFFDKQGQIARFLSANSYNVYIIHTIVLGGIALIMLHTPMPSALKYSIAVVATYFASNAIVSFYRQTIKPKILFGKKENIKMKTALTALFVAMLFVLGGCGSGGDTDVEKQAPQVGLHMAALQGNVVAVKQHLNAGTDLNTKDQYGSTPLIIAATFGQTAVAKALIEGGADLSATNNDGSTPLHIAAFLCREEIVKMLLENGADRNAKNNFGSTALTSVSAPFEDVKGVYDSLGNGLKPLGLVLDYERIKNTRPKIAALLQEEQK